jgi:CRISPR-associated protein Cas2
MYVAVCVELAGDDSRQAAQELLAQYGFKRVLAGLFESLTVTEERLARLKRDFDRITDSYDRIRFYQYPLDDTLVMTDLETKKWRRKKIVF